MHMTYHQNYFLHECEWCKSVWFQPLKYSLVVGQVHTSFLIWLQKSIHLNVHEWALTIRSSQTKPKTNMLRVLDITRVSIFEKQRVQYPNCKWLQLRYQRSEIVGSFSCTSKKACTFWNKRALYKGPYVGNRKMTNKFSDGNENTKLACLPRPTDLGQMVVLVNFLVSVFTVVHGF